MKKITLIILLTCFLFQNHRVLGQTTSEYETIMQGVRQSAISLVNINTLNAAVASTLPTLQADGTWADIDLTSRVLPVWIPDNHLNRIKNFALAYTMPNSNYYGNPALYQAIVNSLTAWNVKDPQSDGSWFDTVSTPAKLGEIMILLRGYPSNPLPTTLENNLIVKMNRADPVNFTGANKLDIATHWIYRGCLKADPVITQKGVNEAYLSISLTTGEGLQYDYSFQQHGAQLYIGGYGRGLVLGEVNVASFLKGTSYELAGTNLDILSKFSRNTYMNATRGKYIDFSVVGRSIARPNGLDDGGMVTIWEKFKTLDPNNVNTYSGAIARLKGTQPSSYLVGNSHTNYWRSDYALHNRSNYSFSVRTVSTRTLKDENGNGENMKGYFLSDGATNIAVKGSEYNNIFPVWEWNKIPGVTAPEYATIPIRGNFGLDPGTSSFVGGVSDGIYGANAYAFKDYGTNAYKSWFFFDDEVVCLGASITSTASEKINTTVNQCLLDGNVTVSANGSTSVLTPGAYNYNGNLQWALHGSVGYVFPQGGNIQLTNQTQTGTWYSVNRNENNQNVSANVFKLWFDHGVNPSNQSYAYIVVPNKTTVAEMQNYDACKIKIVSNNSDVQVVKHTGLNIWQLVFYTPTTFTDGTVKIRVDKPCVMMLKNVGSPNVDVAIADPSQTNAQINVAFDLPGISGTRLLTCNMPSVPYAGSSLSLVVNSSTPLYTTPFSNTTTISAIADTYVTDTTPTAGGPSGFLSVGNATASKYEVYLRFNLNSIQAPVLKAKLKLAVLDAGSPITLKSSGTKFDVRYVPVDSWAEGSTGTNWNTKPATSALLATRFATVDGTATGANIVSANASTAGSILSWDITSQVKSEYGGDKLLSLNVSEPSTYTGTSSVGIRFHSKENYATAFNSNSSTTVRPPQLVVDLDTPPVVLLTAPANNTNYQAGATVSLTANAEDSDVGDSIVKVEFYDGTTKVGEVTTAPFSFDWTNAAVGTHSITAKAYDTVGGSSTSTIVTVTVVANVLPTVAITSPANNASFNTPATVTVTATAADSDGSVSKVEFFQGTTKIGEALTAPYSFDWSNVASGSYALTAKVTDNNNAVVTSEIVNVSVNALPTVVITSPSANASYNAPATVTITVDAADVDGSVSKVEFFNGETKLGEATTAPYSFDWNNVVPGSYALTAKATDNNGAVTTSEIVNVTVNALPTVAITSPANNASYNAPATVTITADAADADGSVSKVEFFNGATKLGESTTAPYSFNWNNVAAGSYALTAIVTDDRAVVVSSDIVNVTVNALPTVAITSPVNNASYNAPATVTITADAADADGSVSKVEFFNGETKLGEATSAPYSFDWTNVASGSYALTSKVTDDKGAVVTSDIVNVSVNALPTIAIPSPANNASYNAPASVTITADAADADGSVSKVEFFNETTKLGEATTAPYSFDWTNVAAGFYILTAKVTDNNGAVTTSEIVNVTVNALPTVAITSPVNNASHNALANVRIDADANDADGNVSKVEFFNGVTKIGEDSTAPYSFNWNNVAAGSYALTAKVSDNNGAVTTSTAVNVNVVCPTVQLSIPDVYAMNPAIDDKNTIYIGYGPTSITLNSLVQGDQDVTYNWNTEVNTPSISVSQAGTYTITASYAGGCQSTASITINTLDVRCGNNDDKVQICHNSNVICVAQSAVQNHLDHGDKLGSCNSTSKVTIKEEVTNSSNFTVYPNPVQDNFNVSISSKLDPKATIGIYNMLGNKLRQVRFATVPQNVFIGDLPSGNYIVVVQNGVETFRSTIVKQ